jgi:hypothetical protein
MTQKNTIRTLLLAITAVLGLAAAAHAQTAGAGIPAPAPDTGKGLLGQTYVNLGYGYMDLHNTSVNLQALRFEYNQPLNTGFDLNLGYTNAWSSRFSGTRNTQQSFDANAVAFMPGLPWGRPYLGVGAGWIWTKSSGVKDNSFLYQLETGVEFQATAELSITPFVKYLDATSLDVSNKWSYGVKGNYWVTNQWGLSASLARDNKVNTTYAVGMNFRF